MSLVQDGLSLAPGQDGCPQPHDLPILRGLHLVNNGDRVGRDEGRLIIEVNGSVQGGLDLLESRVWNAGRQIFPFFAILMTLAS